MKNTLKMFVLALTVLAFGSMSFAAEKGTEKKAEKATEKASRGERPALLWPVRLAGQEFCKC